jgi:hypothetical protein
LKRWSPGKLAWCCQHENIGCAPSPNQKQKDLASAGKIAGGVMGGMAGAAALGLLGASIAEEHHVHKEFAEERREVVHHSAAPTAVPAIKVRNITDAVPTAVPVSKDNSSGNSWWWWCLPLLLLPLLGLCVPALKSLFHKSEGKAERTKRSLIDDAECSSELPMLDTESTCTSMGQQYTMQQSSLSPASIDSFDQRIVSAPLVGTITPPKIKASLTPPRFVGYATPSQQLSPASSFVMEGASTAVSVAGSGTSVLASPTTVVMRSGNVTPPTPSVLVAAAPLQYTQLVEAGTPPVPSPSAGFVVRQW